MAERPNNLNKKFLGNNPFGVQSKLLFHINRINDYVKNDDTVPICMEVNLTNKCNLNCIWCISENMRSTNELDIEIVKKFLKEYKEIGGKSIIFSGGGEPTLHKDFEKIVIYTYELGIDLGLMTNGIYPEKYNQLIGKKFKWIRFSLDTLNKKNYKKWKGVDGVSTVINNVKSLMNEDVRVWVNCNVSEEFSIEEAKKLVTEIPKVVDGLQFRPVLPRYFRKEKTRINHEVWDYLLSLDNQKKINFSRDKLEDVKNENFFPFKYCDGHFIVPILNANGDVCVCMYQTNDKRFVFGNLHTKGFKEIWKSQQRRKVIEFVRNFDYKNNCQVCCKLTETNKFLDFVKHAERPRDVNFI